MRVLPTFAAMVLIASSCFSSEPPPIAVGTMNVAAATRDHEKPSHEQPNQARRDQAPGEDAPASASCPARTKRLWAELPVTPQLPPSTEKGLLSVNGAKIFYARFGHGNSVVLLHGGLANANYWGNQIPALAEAYDVIAIDLRGHGRSSLPAGALSYAVFASDVLGVMDLLRISKAAIVGWSDGAIVGLTLAIEHPNRVTKVFAFGANFNSAGTIPGGSHSPVFSAYSVRTAQEYRALSPQPGNYPGFERSMVRLWGNEPDFSKATLATIRLPVQIADGDHDEIIRLQHTKDLAAAIGSASIIIEPCVSHFAMLQDPRRFNDDVMKFLNDP